MSKRDLFVVVADLDAENTFKTLLCDRQPELGIRLDFDPRGAPQGDILRWPGRDPGCYKSAVKLLRQAQNTHEHALLCFDRHGSGAERKSRVEIEEELAGRLQTSGWVQDHAAVVVLDPELEAWVWAESSHVAELLGWGHDRSGLRSYLEAGQVWPASQPKPSNPKEAMSKALREQRTPRGARLFTKLALQVSFQGCQDPAFEKLRDTLTRWFPR